MTNIDIPENIKHICLVCDGCVAQNKNSIVVSALLHWLTFKAPLNIKEIEIVYPVTGHSFIPTDHVFGQIEKQVRKLDTIINPEDYLKIIEAFSTIRRLGNDTPVYNFKTAMQTVMRPVKDWPFSISQVKRIQVSRTPSTDTITLKGELFYKTDKAQSSSRLFKKGKKISDLHPTITEPTNIIAEPKKKDLKELLKSQFGHD